LAFGIRILTARLNLKESVYCLKFHAAGSTILKIIDISFALCRNIGYEPLKRCTAFDVYYNSITVATAKFPLVLI
jgi:hypothetical protein